MAGTLVKAVNQDLVPAVEIDMLRQDSDRIMADIPVGISACLMGMPVRYNGGHSRSKRCMQQLSEFLRFLPFCPEVAAGFGAPRPSLRLVGNPGAPQLQWSRGGDKDLSSRLRSGFQQQLVEAADLDGYILMKNSPSCGLERIKVYQANGHPHPQRSMGLFARDLRAAYPLLPLEEEGRLNDAHLLENFVLRVYAHHNFRREVLENPGYYPLLCFHRSYKYLLMAHSYPAYRKLGRMLAESRSRALPALIAAYGECFFAALSRPARPAGHANVLLHLLGYLKKNVVGSLRRHIVQVIDEYRLGRLPLITPITLLKHHFELCGDDYIRTQRYLLPYPETLGLRSRI